MLPLLPHSLGPITVLTALTVSMIGAYASLTSSRRRFSADVLSANRQRWTETFRDRLAELLAVMSAAQVVKRASAGRWRGGAGPVKGGHVLAEKLEKTFLAIAQIQLLTNAAEPRHLALNRTIADAVGYLQEEALHEPELSACWDEIIELGRGIIQKEWGRVKRGE